MGFLRGSWTGLMNSEPGWASSTSEVSSLVILLMWLGLHIYSYRHLSHSQYSICLTLLNNKRISDIRCIIIILYLVYSTDIPLCKALSLVWSLVERMSDSLLLALSAGTEESSGLTRHCAILLEIHAEYNSLQFTLMSQMPVTVFCSVSHQNNIQEIIQTIQANATVCVLKNHHCEPAFIKLIWKLNCIFAK